jgi:hypothetical protein
MFVLTLSHYINCHVKLHLKHFCFYYLLYTTEPGQLSRYNDGLEMDVRGSIPGKGKNFLFINSVQIGSGSTQPPTHWVLGTLSPGLKRQGSEADRSPSTAEMVESRLHFPTRLHDVMLN